MIRSPDDGVQLETHLAQSEEERQREEAVQTLAGPVQVDIVREARLRRLEATTSGRGTSPGGENS